MPGFIDSHNHGIYGGRELTKANFNKYVSGVNELLAYAKEKLVKKEGMTGDVLVIYGIDLSAWKLLDEINTVFNRDEFETQPLILHGTDGYTAWSNRAMMAKAGLSKTLLSN